MSIVQEVREVAVPPQPRARPAWWDWVLSVGWVLLAVPLALLEGFLIGEHEEE